MPSFRLGLPLDPRWVCEVALCGVLLAGASMDLLHRRIGNAANVTFLACGLLAALLLDGWGGLLRGLAGAGTGLALLLVPFALRLVRGGDVKFLSALGAWLGPLATVAATVVGFVAAGVLCAVLLATRPALRRNVLANLRGVLLGVGLPAAGELQRRPPHETVPLGAALAAGGLLSLVLGWGTAWNG